MLEFEARVSGREGFSEVNVRTLLMSSQIIRRELHIANSKLFRCCLCVRIVCLGTLNTSGHSLGCSVGCNVANRSFFNMCRRV